jgi:hypothetical protein
MLAALQRSTPRAETGLSELLSNLVFEGCWSCGDLVGVCGFDSVFERDACESSAKKLTYLMRSVKKREKN